jgi:hypothetical protein
MRDAPRVAAEASRSRLDDALVAPPPRSFPSSSTTLPCASSIEVSNCTSKVGPAVWVSTFPSMRSKINSIARKSPLPCEPDEFPNQRRDSVAIVVASGRS